MTKLTDEYMSMFQQTFTVKDIYAMQYALECEYGVGDETASKLECFLEGIKKEKDK